MSDNKNDLFLEIFDRDSIYDRIFDLCLPSTVLRMKRVCQALNIAVSEYMARTFNINKHLSRFFKDAKAFRVVQARTGAIVSGQDAWRFFDRFHEDQRTKLLILVTGEKQTFELCQWLEKNGYCFYPRAHEQNLLSYMSVDGTAYFDPDCFTSTLGLEPEDLWGAPQADLKKVLCRRVLGPLTFRPREGNPVPCDEALTSEERTISVFGCSRSSIKFILSFAETIEMNFYSHAAAYSLFPRPSFDMRWSFMFTPGNEDIDIEEAKLTGESLVYMFPGHITAMSSIHQNMQKVIWGTRGHRSFSDAWTWIIPFPDADEIVSRAFHNSALPSVNTNCYTTFSHIGSRLFLQYRDPSPLNNFTVYTMDTPFSFMITCDAYTCRGLAYGSDPLRDRDLEMHIVLSPLVSQKLHLRFPWSKWSIDQDKKVWGSLLWGETFPRWYNISVEECTCYDSKRMRDITCTCTCPAVARLDQIYNRILWGMSPDSIETHP